MASIFATIRGNFSPLRNQNFSTYLGGQAISLLGTWLQVAAQAWLVWQLTGSEASLGIITALNSLPVLLLGPWAGVWADRMDRRKLLIWTQVAAMGLAFTLAFLTQTGLVQLWHVYLLSFLLGVTVAIDLPAQQAFLGDLTGMGEVRKAVNLNIMMLQVSRVLGPALAGIIANRIGIAPAFWVNGLSFLAVILTLVVVRANQVRTSNATDGNPLHQFVAALQFVRTQPRMQDLFIFATMMAFFVFSIIMNVLPSVASKLLNGDAETYGKLMAASGAGALFSVVFLVPLAQARKRNGVIMLLACCWLVVWLFLLALSRNELLSIMCLFMGSMGAPTVMTMALGLMQVMSPNEMRARLLSLFSTISFGMQPLASVWIGAMAENFGVDRAIEINAVLLLISTVALFVLRPALRQWEFTPTKPMPTPPAPPAEATLSRGEQADPTPA
jgi:MFS family permease